MLLSLLLQASGSLLYAYGLSFGTDGLNVILIARVLLGLSAGKNMCICYLIVNYKCSKPIIFSSSIYSLRFKPTCETIKLLMEFIWSLDTQEKRFGRGNILRIWTKSNIVMILRKLLSALFGREMELK